MGLFDRLFGRPEEPHIEDVVKEALENIDLTEDLETEEQSEAAEQETDSVEEVESDQQETTSEAESQEESLSEEILEQDVENSSQDEGTETVAEEFVDKTSQDAVDEPVENLSQDTEEEPVSETAVEEPVEIRQEAETAEPAPPASSGSSAMADYYAELQARIAEASARNQAQAAPQEEVAPVEEIVEEVASEETVQEKYDRSLRKTRTGFGARLNAFFANFRSVDEEFFEELEELLITSDVGVQVATRLTEELRYEAKLENAKKEEDLRRVIIEKLVDLYEKDGNYNESINFQDGLTVMLFVGVNGVGKTTSIGKLAHKYKQEGKKVMLVAADTFRAGAVAQLAEWGRRVDVPVVTGPEKSDPASVVFDGMERAMAENVDVLMIDTAGRLQNKDNLMAELEKIGRIIKRVLPDAPHETFLALDASTGQNALVQAKEFSKITPVTGIVLTKIDGTARGGVVLAIREELDIPVKLIGFGEKIDDIGEFNSENFMKGLLEGLI